MADKAAHGDKTAEQYRAYYTTGYQTAVDRIHHHRGHVSPSTRTASRWHGTYEGERL